MDQICRCSVSMKMLWPHFGEHSCHPSLYEVHWVVQWSCMFFSRPLHYNERMYLLHLPVVLILCLIVVLCLPSTGQQMQNKKSLWRKKENQPPEWWWPWKRAVILLSAYFLFCSLARFLLITKVASSITCHQNLSHVWWLIQEHYWTSLLACFHHPLEKSQQLTTLKQDIGVTHSSKYWNTHFPHTPDCVGFNVWMQRFSMWCRVFTIPLTGTSSKTAVHFVFF